MTLHSQEPENRLTREASAFRTWAAEQLAAPGARPGEWECDYPDWDRAYAATEAYLRSADLIQASVSVLVDLLYLLARDNESECIAECAAESLQLDGILFLAEQSIALGEPDAKWQLAVQLGELSGVGAARARLEATLLAFAHDEHEYVRRRALQALAAQGAPAVEHLALDAWNENTDAQQWTRMNVLAVLQQVGSTRLPELLIEAAADPRTQLSTFARNMLAGRPGSSRG